MSDLRPARNRKAVNYSNFGDCSDDDFADNTPPPSKKQKSSTSDKGPKKNLELQNGKDSCTEKNSHSVKKPRPALSEKIYERELKEALQLSLLETGHSQEAAVVHRSSDADSKTDSFQLRPGNTKSKTASSLSLDIEHAPVSSLSIVQQEHLVNKKNGQSVSNVMTIGTVMDDSIEILDQSDFRKMTKSKSKTAKTATKKKQISDDENEDDYSSDDESEDTDYNEDSCEISDIDEKPQKKRSAVAARSKVHPPRLKPIKAKKHVTDSGEDTGEESDMDFNAKPQEKKTTATPKSNAQPPRLKPIRGEKLIANTSPKTNQKYEAHYDSKPSVPVTQHLSFSNMAPTSNMSSHSHESPAQSASSKSNKKLSNESPTVKLENPPSALTSSWKPPAMASHRSSNSLPSVKSPTTGLRLGLSRHQNIKRLHKTFKVM